MGDLLKKLKGDRIKIAQNRKPITMELFLSFLTIEVRRGTGHAGEYMGWTRMINDHHKLTVRGGIVGRVEYLDMIEYGENLDNQYNNFVNPFYLWPIMTNDGKRFFLEYYTDDIDDVLEASMAKVLDAESRAAMLRKSHNSMDADVLAMRLEVQNGK